MADKITAEARTNFGKGAARKLRAAGRIPAVVYGHGTDPVHISLPAHETALIIRRANAVLDLTLEGGPLMALVKDVQKDPVRQIIEHLDLIIVRAGEKVEVEVPVVLEGDVFPGTVATLDSQTLLLKVSATAIPERLVVDVEGAQDGTQITAADVTLPEGAELAGDPEALVVGVALAPAEESLEAEAPEGDVVPEEGTDADAES
ncbi:50S ribosomal protein L25/general stress protein Ctc [Amnibacterium kyonggiense]|uniref:Large ribosomal subunit protein bL25 n=1 Tax=Amnibacterium kyonggiense TaxID=595671 RepID=A0A4R7FSC0_9MICO|nr:50S ribosomal protein L25/general stress protein Ctc [Amnibacterium kyonggiense]TDS80733.1 LSU ribosomal protein L25P [Amnibacterium kyonggiense]